MRRFAVASLLVCLFSSMLARSVRADAQYDDAFAVEQIYDRICKALNDLDIPTLVNEFTDDGTASVWNKDTELLGKAQTTGALMAWAAQRKKDEFHPAPVRIFLDGKVAWATFAWTWGEPWKGDAIGVVQKEGTNWKVRSIDFYSVRLERPINYFDPREPVRRMKEALAIYQTASDAFRNGDAKAIAAGAHSEFRYVDKSENVFDGADGFAAMQNDPAIAAFRPDEATLYVSNLSDRAIAKQQVDKATLYIVLRQERDALKVAHVTHFEPPLRVAPKHRLITTWAAIRRDER